MKKLIFLFAFVFIGQQAFPQMYIVIVNSMSNTGHPSGCALNFSWYNRVMTTVSPSGAITYTCLVNMANTDGQDYATAISTINQEFNTIVKGTNWLQQAQMPILFLLNTEFGILPSPELQVV